MLEAYERLCDVRSPQAANFLLRLTLDPNSLCGRFIALPQVGVTLLAGTSRTTAV